MQLLYNDFDYHKVVLIKLYWLLYLIEIWYFQGFPINHTQCTWNRYRARNFSSNHGHHQRDRCFRYFSLEECREQPDFRSTLFQQWSWISVLWRRTELSRGVGTYTNLRIAGRSKNLLEKHSQILIIIRKISYFRLKVKKEEVKEILSKLDGENFPSSFLFQHPWT